MLVYQRVHHTCFFPWNPSPSMASQLQCSLTLMGPKTKKRKKKNQHRQGQHSLKAENRIQKLIHHGFREIPTGLPFRSPWRFSCATLANSSLVQQIHWETMWDRSGLLPSISIYAPPPQSHTKKQLLKTLTLRLLFFFVSVGGGWHQINLVLENICMNNCISTLAKPPKPPTGRLTHSCFEVIAYGLIDIEMHFKG